MVVGPLYTRDMVEKTGSDIECGTYQFSDP